MKDFQLLIYNTPTEDIKVDVILKDEDIWASQKAMASLFGVQVPDISKHINNIFESGELTSSTTVSKMETVVQRGFRGQVPDEITLYSLDMIIAVGYRVSSARATAFRIWATGILKEYIKKGFVLDDERMKNGGALFGKDYFRELLERVRSIRASERRIWQQITVPVKSPVEACYNECGNKQQPAEFHNHFLLLFFLPGIKALAEKVGIL